MKQDQAVVFILDALEHERGSLRVYRAAVDCAQDKERKRQWGRYRTACEQRVSSLEKVCAALGISLDHLTPARDIIRDIGAAHVRAIEAAAAEADAATAEVIACESVAFAQAKSRANRELLTHVATALSEPARQALATALERPQESVADQPARARRHRRELLLRKLGITLAPQAPGTEPDAANEPPSRAIAPAHADAANG
jgi:hypothetical protein